MTDSTATTPQRFHLDKRARALLNEPGDDDDLLDTKQIADWLGTSVAWVEGARTRPNGGPPFIRMHRMIRYRRSSVRGWLQERERNCTR